MKAIDNVQNRIDGWSDRIGDYLEKQSPRDRFLVIFLAVFVVLLSLGSALWSMHVAAENQQKRLNELKDLVVWMQGNVVTMKPADDLAMTTAEKIQRVAQQQNLSVASQQAGEQLQIIAQHENYAILANLLTQMAQMGISIEKLELNKVDAQIKLTATVQ